jgi:hypothetical protein
MSRVRQLFPADIQKYAAAYNPDTNSIDYNKLNNTRVFLVMKGIGTDQDHAFRGDDKMLTEVTGD